MIRFSILCASCIWICFIYIQCNISLDELYEGGEWYVYSQPTLLIEDTHAILTQDSNSTNPTFQETSAAVTSIESTSTSTTVLLHASIIGDPLFEATSSGFTVEFSTDLPCFSQIEYAMLAGFPLGWGIRNPAIVSGYQQTEHSFSISGLQSNNIYYVRIILRDRESVYWVSEHLEVSTTVSETEKDPPELVDGPHVENITQSTADIYWVTNEAATEQVLCSTQDGFTYPEFATPPMPSTTQTYIHRITLENLITGTTYYFKVQSDDALANRLTSEQYSFQTMQNGYPQGWVGGGHPYAFNMDWTSDAGHYDGFFYQPCDIDIDSSGNMYIADYYNNRIQKWTESGEYLGWIGKEYDSGDHHIDAFRKGGMVDQHTCTGDPCNIDGLLLRPGGIAVDRVNEFLYIYDTNNYRIQKYTLEGAFVGWVGYCTDGSLQQNFASGTGKTPSCGSADGQFSCSAGNFGIDVDETTGHLYIADYNNFRVQKWTTDGVYVGWIGQTSAAGVFHEGATGFAAGDLPRIAVENLEMHINYPIDVVVDEEAGYVYIVDGQHHHIDRWTTAGVYSGFIGDGHTEGTWITGEVIVDTDGDVVDHYFSGPNGLALDINGNLYISEACDRIQKWTSEGEYKGWIGRENGADPEHYYFEPGNSATVADGDPWEKYGFYDPRGLIIDLQGNILIADFNNHRIVKW